MFPVTFEIVLEKREDDFLSHAVLLMVTLLYTVVNFVFIVIIILKAQTYPTTIFHFNFKKREKEMKLQKWCNTKLQCSNVVSILTNLNMKLEQLKHLAFFHFWNVFYSLHFFRNRSFNLKLPECNWTCSITKYPPPLFLMILYNWLSLPRKPITWNGKDF